METSNALCKGRLDLFFDEDPASVALAKSICSECPLAGLCLAGAMARRELYGVWGGTDYYDRVALDPEYPPRDEIEHGTPKGFNQHKAHGISIQDNDPCGCLEANRASARMRMTKYRAKKRSEGR